MPSASSSFFVLHHGQRQIGNAELLREAHRLGLRLRGRMAQDVAVAATARANCMRAQQSEPSEASPFSFRYVDTDDTTESGQTEASSDGARRKRRTNDHHVPQENEAGFRVLVPNDAEFTSRCGVLIARDAILVLSDDRMATLDPLCSARIVSRLSSAVRGAGTLRI